MSFCKNTKLLTALLVGVVMASGVGVAADAKQKQPPKSGGATPSGPVIYLPGFRVLVRPRPAPKPEPPIIDPIIVVQPPFW